MAMRNPLATPRAAGAVGRARPTGPNSEIGPGAPFLRRSTWVAGHSGPQKPRYVCSPEKWDHSVANALRVCRVAFELLFQETFFDEDTHGERGHGKEHQQRSGIRFKPQGGSNKVECSARVNRMAHDAVGAGVDQTVVAFLLKPDGRRGEWVFFAGERNNHPTCAEQRQSTPRNK